MKNVLLFLLLVSGCGSAPKAVLPASEDLSAAVFDLAEDLYKEPPADMFMACSMPQPGLYMEYSNGTYSSSVSPSNLPFSYNISVIVKNNGDFIKVPPSPYTPVGFYCDYPMNVDPTLCTAKCCAGASSPILYFAWDGWRLVTPGSCTRTDPNNGNLFYFYQVTGELGAQ